MPARDSTGQGFLPSLTEIQNLTDLEEIEALLKDTISRETALDNELEQNLKESEKLEYSLESLETLPIRLKPAYKESKTLASTINVACNLAENVSKKVRDLDIVRARVKESLKKVSDIIDVKKCYEGVHKALQQENYEEAAAHIERYLNIDESVLEEASATQIRSAEKDLKDILKRKLEEVMKTENEKEILRFCSLYVPLGMKEEGLTRYSHYLRNVVSNLSEAAHRQLQRSLGHSHTPQNQDEEQISPVDAITRIFETVAAIIQEKSKVVEEKFGPGSVVVLIKNLQMQTDVHATKILDLFIEHFGVKRIIDELGAQRKRNDSQSRDPRELAPILDQIALMSQSTELFDRFIRNHAKEALETSKKLQPETANANPRKNNDGLLHVSELNRRMQEMIGQFMLLEEYFMVESAKKAIKMDDITPESITSSSVDHVFYVLQKSGQRALLTSNVNAVCATINIIITVLTRDLKEFLSKNLQEQLSRLATSTASGMLPSSLRATDKPNYYTVLLNNLEVSSEYILKLRKEIESQCGQVFSNMDVKIKSCLDDVTEASNTFKKLLQNYMEQASTHITAKIKPFLDVFTAISYELTDVDFAEREINDPFVEQFISGVDSVVKPYKVSLTLSNYDSLVHVALRHICTRLEHEILKKKFNQLGGLQFDKELRSLQNYFAGLTQKTVRDKFARITQMAALLYLEKVNEVLDYWGQNSAHMTWRLTPGEVRRVLGLRVDFSKDAIAKLKL